MATFKHGKGTRVYVNGYDLSTMLQSVNLTLEVPALDVTTFAADYKSYISSLVRGGSIQMDGLYTVADNELNDIFYDAILAGTELNITYVVDEGAGGSIGYFLPTQRTGHAVTQSITEAVRLSVDCVISDESVIGYSLGPLEQRTAASQTDAGVDLGAGFTATRAAVGLQVTQFTSGDNSITVTVETASNATFDADLATIATITATALGAYSVADSAQSVLRYVRLKAACGAGETITCQAILQVR